MTENDILLKSVLQGTFFNAWKNDKQDLANVNFKGLEIYLTPNCNLRCKYCYLQNHKQDLYPEHLTDSKVILENLSMLLDWLIDNNYKPKIDIFSGELFSQKLGFDALELIHEKLKGSGIKQICIPTNFTFICSEKLTERVENYIEKFKNIGIRLALSCSMDGKYCEDNRPANGEMIRDDDYYDRVFEFCKKYGYGFHPMIYSTYIENWIDNFSWFIEMFDKHGYTNYPLYLLEVRNEEWTEEQMAKFGEFVQYLVRWCRGKGRDVHKEGFNILGSMVSKIGRGIGCGLQSALYVRMGDLMIVPCHRTSYDGLEYGQFITDGGKITGINARNVENCIAALSFEADTLPMCETCFIKDQCSHGCMGCQYETVGDMFIPNPNVCKLEWYKVEYFNKEYKNGTDD
ncbi:MAG: radical SAM protein [Candidatus Paceibacterota bacterium]